MRSSDVFIRLAAIWSEVRQQRLLSAVRLASSARAPEFDPERFGGSVLQVERRVERVNNLALKVSEGVRVVNK